MAMRKLSLRPRKKLRNPQRHIRALDHCRTYKVLVFPDLFSSYLEVAFEPERYWALGWAEPRRHHGVNAGDDGAPDARWHEYDAATPQWFESSNLQIPDGLISKGISHCIFDPEISSELFVRELWFVGAACIPSPVTPEAGL
jgi:hypothetical protein